jgi:hypothetical protein
LSGWLYLSHFISVSKISYEIRKNIEISLCETYTPQQKKKLKSHKKAAKRVEVNLYEWDDNLFQLL